MKAVRLAALVLGLVAPAAPAAVARAEISRAALAQVGVHPPAGARAPLDLAFRDQDGRPTSLGAAKGTGPALLVFTAYRCNTLCGPALAIVAAAVKNSRLRPGTDFRLVTVGIDPAATAADARTMRASRLGGDPALLAASSFLLGDRAAIDRATHALGYGYAYDPADGQYTHPVAAFVLAPDGGLTRVLSEVALTGPQLERAIQAARADAPPAGRDDLIDQLSLLCHGLIPASGANDDAVMTGLRLGGGATLLLMAAGLVGLMLRRRRSA